MDTFFSPFDPLYAGIALSVVLLDGFVLRSVLPLRLWCLLRLPSTFLHELAHWVPAFLLGGRPSMTLWPSVDENGYITLGRVEWHNLGLGFVGQALVSLAPFGWLMAGLIVSRLVFSQPHTFLEGLGWLAVCMAMVGAGLRLSASDLANMDWLSRVCFVLYMLLFIAYGMLFHLPDALCEWFEPSCQLFSGWVPA